MEKYLVMLMAVLVVSAGCVTGGCAKKKDCCGTCPKSAKKECAGKAKSATCDKAKAGVTCPVGKKSCPAGCTKPCCAKKVVAKKELTEAQKTKTDAEAKK